MVKGFYLEERQVLGKLQALSPRILLASWISLGMMVTLFAWMAQRLVSSKRPTRYASLASWRAITAELWNLRSVLKSWAISRTRRWNGSLRMSSRLLVPPDLTESNCARPVAVRLLHTSSGWGRLPSSFG